MIEVVHKVEKISDGAHCVIVTCRCGYSVRAPYEQAGVDAVAAHALAIATARAAIDAAS